MQNETIVLHRYSLREHIADFAELTKPRITLMVLITTLVGFYMASEGKLDWRLLPSISLVESGGGRAAHNNNLFGWDGGRAIFASLRAGIHDVASHLGTSKLYRNKDVDGILRTYNPNADYPGVVKSVMRRISPSEQMMIATRCYSSNRTTK